ncbi:hypothetical protein HN51_005306 [Arachis hypogaea]|uniref:Uncharacterized protein n=1 Tax=Arachis hypogaea TaxID=3818 RepID=A0A445DF60_ARAHY|nr:uncharacterized protein DS421_4g125720 [Arachis hypogaea]RYR61814.1 hypothetical protein Ahy_A04g019039 [Arachis hypogaea]
MEKWKGWRYFKSFPIYKIKSILRKLSSKFRCKQKRQRNGLVSLYKDMESCGEYSDIQVMWKMIQSSSSYSSHQYASCSNKKRRTKRSSYWVLCFRPT